MSIADGTTTSWIRRFRTGPDQDRRLVCFPHAGGAATFFHPVAMRFGPAVDVVALQYPGRQDRRSEPMIEDIATLADRIADELLRLSDKPSVFFGHSMGAVLAFETAWRLERRGTHAPRAVMVSGRRAPSAHRPDHQVYLRDDEGLLAELKLLNGTAMNLMEDEEVRRMTLPAVRNDYRAIETYRCAPGRVTAAAITTLTGTDDPQTTVAEAAKWREFTTGEFRLATFPGGHFFLAEQPGPVLDEVERGLAQLDTVPR
ncbi:surfactin synthase thioesterase subunit [Krasilnikovia cinnamomea]|uniref:Surfactin synthase thioesterase subunit n=1 Tax=Krasilnikovia cinnamomea TaxID=349313 RepID=A0A4Q7ZUD5_9ACTN|nr:alpha/beta fold hydrolase [Krasilnikovia cinnamomea]RZU54195.1 surfactin synthase thioesterase subunit [Krasilnikovia cinnamomea]